MERAVTPVHKLRSFAALGATLFVLVACQAATDGGNEDGSGAPTEPTRGGDLVFARGGDPSGLDPTAAFDGTALFTARQIFDTLTDPAPDGSSTDPWLATDWEVADDELTWTFHLRPGVMFSDGEALTSADVKFSLERLLGPNVPIGYLYEHISAVKAPDPATVVIRTDQPWPSLPSSLSYVASGIVPKDLAGLSEDAFYEKPIGSGPFQVESWSQGEKLKLVRNPHYWQEGKPYLDSVTFTVVPDDNTRLLQLKGGQADIAGLQAGPRLEGVDGTGGLNVETFEGMGLEMISVNAQEGPLQDAGVRRAIQLAIDREALVKGVLGGFASPADSFLPPGVQYYAEVPAVTYDLTTAKEELAATPYASGFDIEMLVPGADPVASSVAQVVQDQLSALGITVSLKTLDEGAVYEARAAGEYEMALVGYTSDITDPAGLTSWLVNGGTGWDLPEATTDGLDEKATEAAGTFVEDDRAALYTEIQQAVGEEAPQIPIYYFPYTSGFTDEVGGFSIPTTGYYHLEDVWLTGSAD